MFEPEWPCEMHPARSYALLVNGHPLCRLCVDVVVGIYHDDARCVCRWDGRKWFNDPDCPIHGGPA